MQPGEISIVWMSGRKAVALFSSEADPELLVTIANTLPTSRARKIRTAVLQIAAAAARSKSSGHVTAICKG